MCIQLKVSVLLALAVSLGAGTGSTAADKAKDPSKKANHAGRITTMSPDGKTITLETKSETGEVSTVQIKLTESTKVELMGLGFLGTEKNELRVGYYALVWLLPGSKDTARGIRANLHKPDVLGKITAVSGDGKTITLETKNKSGEAAPTEITITDRTKIEFVGIDKEEDQKLKPDYHAIVWLQRGSKTVAGSLKVGIRKEKEGK